MAPSLLPCLVESHMSRKTNRRDFLKQTAVAGVGFWMAGGVTLAESTSANEKLNIAIVGAGGRGGNNLRNSRPWATSSPCATSTSERAAKGFKDFPKAKKYNDFRKMLDEAEGHRRRRRQHARPHARRGQRDGHAAGQARLLPEAADARRLRGPGDARDGRAR